VQQLTPVTTSLEFKAPHIWTNEILTLFSWEL